MIQLIKDRLVRPISGFMSVSQPKMMPRLGARARVLLLILPAPILIALLLLAVFTYRRHQLAEELLVMQRTEAESHLSQVVADARQLAQIADQELAARLRLATRSANEIMGDFGGVVPEKGTEDWLVVDQKRGGVSKRVTLPRWRVGKDILSSVGALERGTAVDEIKETTSADCTVFQRINDQGDMARVLTTVLDQNGDRATGTYISAQDSNGAPNPVLAKVLAGEPYEGRAWVVGRWYIARYEPIWLEGKVAGMFFVGLLQESLTQIHDALAKTKLGREGYIWIINAQGAQKGHYYLSKGGLRDGESLWDTKDANGDLFVQGWVERAPGLADGKIEVIRYPWQNRGEVEPQMKLAAMTYYAPLDWIIGASIHENEALGAALASQDALSAFGDVIVWVALFALLTLLPLAWWVSGSMVKPLIELAEVADAVALGDVDVTVNHQSHDEIGQVADAFRRMVASVKVTAAGVDKMARGDLSSPFVLRSEGDLLSRNLERMRSTLGVMVQEIQTVGDNCRAGKLQTRAKTDGMEGAYAVLITGMNGALAAMAEPMGVSADYLDRIARGEIPPTLNRGYQGDFKAVEDNLNRCVGALSGLMAEINSVSERHDAGDIDVVIQSGHFAGAYRTLAEGINQMVAGHISVKKKAIDCVGEFGRGNFDAPLERFPGKKAFINEVIESVRQNLRRVVGDAEKLSAAAVSGDLSIRAEASHHHGDFKKIVVGLNGIMDAVAAPLGEASSALERVAGGDLLVEMRGSYEGEYARIKDNLNRMVADLRRSMQAIGTNAGALGVAAEGMGLVSHQLGSTAEETAAQANAVTSAAEEVNRSVQTVAAGAGEMSASIQEIAKNTAEAARIAQQAVKHAERSNATVTKLGASSAEIDQVVKVITSIAQQTNLLALNATIEAARAGAAGKGFAVVANEVKELAKETAAATEEIGRKIEAIQVDTQDAVGAISEIAEIIHRFNDISNTIASAIEEQAATTNEISRNVGEAARGAADIAQNISGVAAAAETTTTAAGNTQQSSAELSRMAAELQRLLGQFRFEADAPAALKNGARAKVVVQRPRGVH